MSYDLGHSRGYIYNISSGRALPPMTEFLQICDYFNITPAQFFDTSSPNSALLETTITELKKLDDDDLLLILGNIRRLTRDSLSLIHILIFRYITLRILNIFK